MHNTKTFSGYQLFWVMFLFNVGMAVILTTGRTILEAKQDAWISETIAGVISILVTWIAIRVNKMYPQLSFVQLCKRILGKWFGTLFVVPYVMYWGLLTGIIARQVADYLLQSLFSNTPLIVLISLMILTVFYMIHAGGIESIGRVSNLLGPFTVLFVLTIDILSLLNANPERLLPLNLVDQWENVLKGSTPTASFTTNSLVAWSIVPLLKRGDERAARGSLWGVGLASLFITLNTLIILMTLGSELPGRMLHPKTFMTTFISVGEFIQNLDIILSLVWFFSAAIRMAVYQIAAANSLADLLGIRNWRMANLAISLVSVVIAMIPKTSSNLTSDFILKFVVPIAYPYLQLGGPALLLLMGTIRKSVGIR